MNVNLSNCTFGRMLIRILSVVVILAMTFPSLQGASALDSDPLGNAVGIVLPVQNERWLRDAVELENHLQAAGIGYEILFSDGDAGLELANVETLISHGIQILIISPVDDSTVGAVEAARAANIKVISYDRLIMNTNAVDFYVTFDGIEVGRAQGQYIIAHAQGTGNPLYLYAGASWDNNSFLFFEGAWQVLQPRIDDGTFVIKNSSMAVSLQDKLELNRDEQSAIIGQITTNWSYDDAMSLAVANLGAVTGADKGNVFILAPNDETARAIGDAYSADPDVMSYILTGQDADKDSIQYIMYGRQSMTVFKDVRTLASDAAATAITFLQGQTPESDKTYNNGMIDVPAHASAVVVVDRSNVRSALIDTGYYQVSDFIWHDNFQGPLTEGWYWVNENAEKWEFNDGFLRIHASTYGAGGENLLLKPVASSDFMIKTRLVFEPDTNFQFAGLVIWQDEYNFLQLGRAFCDVEGACVGNGLYFDRAEGGNSMDGNFATPIGNPSDVFLRLERRGNMVRAFYSMDEGISWYEIGTHWLPDGFQVNGVGLTASQDFSGLNIPADFDFFELTEGRGFLPEGFHDGEQGDVPSWACNANGWAADPDDRTADVNVEIVVDDQTVTTLVAGEFRQDLYDAGVCEDGNCSFSTGLWDLISSYEPHNIDAWAQDTTGEWVLLSNSDKTLTCRTYDIYGYAPLTGTTKQITGIEGTDPHLRKTDEYNPSWSPNGKKVAHDVVSGDSQSIYITDVKTGVSASLVGAGEGSNDAAWSPNGKWIVFGRAFDEVPSLYIVPAVGGTSSPLIADAVSADWAPSGKRLVYQQPSGGSIRTIAVDGGSGGETTVTDSGANPAWSPDGNWIAYEKDGDIWKVQVNVRGTALGDPIQVTSGPFWDGQPTWSADSTMIVYHTGFNDADYDLWSVPAAGGEPTWLTGAPNFGDYDPAYARNGSAIAYGSFSPNGQSPRSWVAAFTYDLPAGYWTEGTHTYHFETSGPDNSSDLSFDVGNDKTLYDGTVLLRPWSVIGRTGEECSDTNAIHSTQPTKFYVGWTAEGTYSDALTYYENLMAKVAWDGGDPVDLVRHEVFPLTSPVDWFGYTCTYTAGPPAPTFVAYMPVTIVGYSWPAGNTIDLSINDGEYTAQATAGNFDEDPTAVIFELWRDDYTMEVGDHIVMTDGTAHISKELWVTNLAVTDFDFDTEQVFGVYDPAYDLWTWLHDLEGQVPETDPDSGTWIATFNELPPGAWGGATQWDEDGDGTSLDFQVPTARVVVANQQDWVSSGITLSEGQSFKVAASGSMNPCSDTYPGGDEICIFYTPVGADRAVLYDNQFGVFPGLGLNFMALLGRIGDGEPFVVGAGGTFTAAGSGTLWFTPNDNLRTDNQGAYSVLVWLE